MSLYSVLVQGYTDGLPDGDPTLFVVRAYDVRDAMDRVQANRIRGFVHAGRYDTARISAAIPGEPLYVDPSQRVDRLLAN